jgi:hypothetical protein
MIPVPSDNFRTNLQKLAGNIEHTAKIVRQAHFLAAQRWDAINFGLGLAAVLVGVVGGTGSVVVANLPLAGVFATIAGMLGAANSYVRPADRTDKHKRAGDDWSILRDRAADLYKLKMSIPQVPMAKLQKEYEDLLKSKAEITKSSPIIPRRTYYSAMNRAKDEEKKKEAAAKAII